MHENFNDTHYNNDIAIFKMDRPVPFSKDVMPVCLEKAEFVQELLKPRKSSKPYDLETSLSLWLKTFFFFFFPLYFPLFYL